LRPKVYYIVFFLCFAISVNSQTIGTLTNDYHASEDLILFSPILSQESYLVDKCGYIYNQWSSQFLPGLASYLDKEGNLIRTGEVQNAIFNSSSGLGGVLESYDWSGNLNFQIGLSNDNWVSHHDIEILENGNIMVTLRELLSKDHVIALGRDSSFVNDKGFYNEIIMEIKVTGFDTYDVVWSWSAIEHIIQDFDPSLPNYGDPANHPERLDINGGPYTSNVAVDWLHINCIDYNPVLDQVLLSCHSISEIIIIDRSTTTLSAQSSTGGNANKGGDLLFRWGNPNNYVSTPAQQTLFGQHDANWILKDGVPTDEILLFNNSNKVNGMPFSNVLELKLDRVDFNYDFESTQLQQKDDIIWEYTSIDSFDFYARFMSGAIKLTNGNRLITEATKGRAIEVDDDGEIVWEYINPVNFNGPMSQFDMPIGNTIFKTASYPLDFFNADVPIVSTMTKIELDPVDNCEIVSATTGLLQEQLEVEILYHLDYLKITAPSCIDCHYQIIDLNGRVLDANIFSRQIQLSTLDRDPQLYVLHIYDDHGMSSQMVFF